MEYIELKYNEPHTFKNDLEQIIKSNILINEVVSRYPIEIPQNKKIYQKIPFWGTIAGILGFLGGFIFQVWVNIIAYPLNFGGKPGVAVPSFIVVSFECAIMFSGLTMFSIFMFQLFKSKKKFDIKENTADFIIQLKTDKETMNKLKLLNIHVN